MAYQLINWEFGIALLLAIIFSAVIYFATKHYWKPKNNSEVKIHADFIRIPMSNTLTVLGMLLPLLAALTSYLFSANANGNYALLLASITVLLFALLLAIWVTFSLLQKGTEDNVIKLKIPEDLAFIQTSGIAYTLIILGLLYVVGFFLFRFEYKAVNTATSLIVNTNNSIYLEKPMIQVNQKKNELIQLWGTPSIEDKNSNSVTYIGNSSEIRISLDANETIQELTVRRK